MSKKLNTTGITNELVGSSFFPKPAEKREEDTVKTPASTRVKLTDTEPQRPAPARQPIQKPHVRQLDSSSKREFARRSFDFFADQLEFFKKLSLEEQLEGKEGSQNEMAREAFDDYIKKRSKK